LVIKLLLIPLIGGFIGWITNVLAIKLIFWPYEPVKIPLLNVEIQGIIPKRRREIAANIGQIVERELLSVEDLIKYLNAGETQRKISSITIAAVKKAVMARIPRYIPTPIKNMLEKIIEDSLVNEIPGLINWVSGDFSGDLRRNLNLSKIVEDKLNSLDIVALERLALEVAARELGHIKIMGLVLGFLIGLIQVAFIFLLY